MRGSIASLRDETPTPTPTQTSTRVLSDRARDDEERKERNGAHRTRARGVSIASRRRARRVTSRSTRRRQFNRCDAMTALAARDATRRWRRRGDDACGKIFCRRSRRAHEDVGDVSVDATTDVMASSTSGKMRGECGSNGWRGARTTDEGRLTRAMERFAMFSSSVGYE